MRPLRLLRELLRATPFRWALLVAAAFAVCTLVLFGFFYWQTCMYVTANIDGAIMEEASLIAGDPPNEGHRKCWRPSPNVCATTRGGSSSLDCSRQPANGLPAMSRHCPPAFHWTAARTRRR